jgi:hypothetical protein
MPAALDVERSESVAVENVALRLRARSDRSERSGNNRCRVERASEDRRERVTKVLFVLVY